MKRVNKKLVIGSALMVACTSLTSCSGSFASMGSAPDFELRGNADGIDAFYQGIMGEIEAAKTVDGSAPFAQETYRQKEATKRLRYIKPAARK